MAENPVVESLVERILELESNESNSNSRFVDINIEDTSNIIQVQENTNTQKTTRSHIRLFQEWLATKNEFRDCSQIESNNLDNYLAQFFLSVRKAGTNANGNLNNPERQYEPSTLLAIHSSVFRHLRKCGYGINIKTDERFIHSRNVLSAKLKELKQMGKGNKPNAAQAFSPDDIDALYNKNQLGLGKEF
jgi:hypothetical protein